MSGITDESSERGWDEANYLGTSTRKMGCSRAQRDRLDSVFGDYEWKKNISLGGSVRVPWCMWCRMLVLTNLRYITAGEDADPRWKCRRASGCPRPQQPPRNSICTNSRNLVLETKCLENSAFDIKIKSSKKYLGQDRRLYRKVQRANHHYPSLEPSGPQQCIEYASPSIDS